MGSPDSWRLSLLACMRCNLKHENFTSRSLAYPSLPISTYYSFFIVEGINSTYAPGISSLVDFRRFHFPTRRLIPYKLKCKCLCASIFLKVSECRAVYIDVGIFLCTCFYDTDTYACIHIYICMFVWCESIYMSIRTCVVAQCSSLAAHAYAVVDAHKQRNLTMSATRDLTMSTTTTCLVNFTFLKCNYESPD